MFHTTHPITRLAPRARGRAVALGVASLLIAEAQASPAFELDLVDGRAIEARAISLSEGGALHCRMDTGETVDLHLQDLIRLRPSGHQTKGPPPALAGRLTLHLADGGVLAARLLESKSDAPRTLQVQLAIGPPAAIPLGELTAIQSAVELDRPAEQEFAARLADRRPDRDLIVIPKDGACTVAPGSLERISADGWEFRFGGQTRTGKLVDVYGFILAASAAPRPPRHATLLLDGGDRLTANLTSAGESGVVLDAGFAEPLELPWRAIRLIQFRSPRIVFLSDLEPAEVNHASLTGASWPIRKDSNVTGGPMQLAGQRYARGLGMHALTSVTYDLDEGFERFTAIAGLDDSVAPFGSVIFRVLADGDERYASALLRPGMAPERISIELHGVKKLTLVADPADELDLSDHANWAEAIVIRARKPDAE